MNGYVRAVITIGAGIGLAVLIFVIANKSLLIKHDMQAAQYINKEWPVFVTRIDSLGNRLDSVEIRVDRLEEKFWHE